jgi:hypothetical protein
MMRFEIISLQTHSHPLLQELAALKDRGLILEFSIDEMA